MPCSMCMTDGHCKLSHIQCISYTHVPLRIVIVCNCCTANRHSLVLHSINTLGGGVTHDVCFQGSSCKLSIVQLFDTTQVPTTRGALNDQLNVAGGTCEYSGDASWQEVIRGPSCSTICASPQQSHCCLSLAKGDMHCLAQGCHKTCASSDDLLLLLHGVLLSST